MPCSETLTGQAIRAARDALFADPSLHGRAFCRAYANRADAWLTTLLGAETDVALVAVGGYGRAELAPGSDLDVILLHRGRPRSDAEVRALAERIWYPLWDAGLKLGHGVRTVKEALALAATDLDTATSLLDVRLIAGDSGLSDDLARRAEAQWQSRSDRWLPVVGEAVADRHERAGGHVGPGIVIRDGVVELTAEADPISDPTVALRAAAAAAEAGLRISRQAADRLAVEAAPLGDPWPEEARLAFVRLLGAGPAAIPVIETLDQRGLMTRMLPEWEPVRNRPQRNAYHRFTVDRHLCEAAAEAARLTSRVRRPDLLLVGALLHDIANGYPRDHSEAGVSPVQDLCARMGFAPDDIAIL